MNENNPTRKTRNAIVISIAILALGAVVLLWPQPSQKAPEIIFTLIDGKKLPLQSLRGRPVLLSFWATTCKICIAKTPAMIALYHQLRPEGLEIIAVAMPYDPPTHVVAMVVKMKMPYPVALDINSNAVRAFGDVKVTPTTILISPKGSIVWRKQGKFVFSKLKARIRNLIESSNENKYL